MPSLGSLPGMSLLKNALGGAKNAAEEMKENASGAIKGAVGLANGIGDGAHGQLKNFGAQTSKNIGTAVDGAAGGWMAVHNNIDRAYEETQRNMKR